MQISRMKWERKSSMYIESDCYRFRINKAFINGEPVYQSARVIPQPSVIVLGRGTLEECKQACEEAK